MKKLLFTLFSIATFFSSSAQEGGWYADGVKVDKLTCYTFDKFQAAVQYNQTWASYDYLSIHMFYGEEYTGGLMNGTLQYANAGGVVLLPTSSIGSQLRNGYLVYTLYADTNMSFEVGSTLTRGDQSTYGIPNTVNYGLTDFGDFLIFRKMLAVEEASFAKNDGKPADDQIINFDIYGVTITGYKEYYSENCSCIKKKPIYSAKKLTRTFKATCTNRIYFKYKKTGVAPPNLKGPCNYEGKKLDFLLSAGANNVGGSNNSNVNYVAKSLPKQEMSEWEKNKGKGEGPYKSFDANGKIETEGMYKNDKEVGLWKRYSNGIVTGKDYKNNKGELDSSFTYNEKGKLIYETRWKNNKKNGIWREYSSDGVIEKMEIYKDDMLNGKNIRYEDGKIYIECYYKEGQLDGVWNEYEDGKVRVTKRYVNGEEQN